jgi:hypothetical protein
MHAATETASCCELQDPGGAQDSWVPALCSRAAATGLDHFASYNGTAPIEVSSGNRKINRLSLRGNRRINHAIHMAAITQIRHAHSDGRACYDRKLAEGKTLKKHFGASSGGSATPSTPASSPTPARPPATRQRAREGNRGTTLTPARPARTPSAGSSDKPLPSPASPYDPPPRPGEHHPHPRRRKPAEVLDKNIKEGSICTPLLACAYSLRRSRTDVMKPPKPGAGRSRARHASDRLRGRLRLGGR